LITLLGAAAWPLAARAQQPGKAPTVGFLGASSAPIQSRRSPSSYSACANSVGSMAVLLGSMFAGRRDARNAPLRSQLNCVRLKVEIFVTLGAAAYAAKQATGRVFVTFVP
jgi:hypothetical protein